MGCFSGKSKDNIPASKGSPKGETLNTEQSQDTALVPGNPQPLIQALQQSQHPHPSDPEPLSQPVIPQPKALQEPPPQVMQYQPPRTNNSLAGIGMSRFARRDVRYPTEPPSHSTEPQLLNPRNSAPQAPVQPPNPPQSTPPASYPLKSHPSGQDLHRLSHYYRQMSALWYDTCAFQSTNNTNVNSQRVISELEALSRSLPCEAHSAFFLRWDTHSLRHFQVMMSGVEGTPYAHGLYLFDVSLPEGYPATPPTVILLTTGRAAVRFSPNLRTDGTVCLPILNTGRTPSFNAWIPETSTIYEVLFSIQSLVLTGNIASKEQGYEVQAENGAENRLCSAVVRYANVRYAIAGMILFKPIGFEQVVHKHFTLKKDRLLAEVQQWVSESASMQDLLTTTQLARKQNPSIMQEFAKKGIAQCYNEAQQEVIAALDLVY